MSNLSKVYIVKIGATVIFWCAPLILLPRELLSLVGFPEQDTYMFVRMLGWAYLTLCVGYGFGLRAALKGELIMTPVYVGMCSNGGALLFLFYYGMTGTWSDWGMWVQFIGWSSVVATLLITTGLYLYGVREADA